MLDEGKPTVEDLERVVRVSAVELHVGEELVGPGCVRCVLGELEELESLPGVAGRRSGFSLHRM